MMSQAVFGYTGWQQPDAEVMPELRTLAAPKAATMAVAIEGSAEALADSNAAGRLPAFDAFADQSRTIEIFNRGRTPFRFRAKAGKPWVRISQTSGDVADQTALSVSDDWAKAPAGKSRAPITLRGPGGREAIVWVEAFNPEGGETVRGSVETNKHVAIEVAHHARAVPANGIAWREIPNLGHTLSGITPFPVTAPVQEPGSGPCLEYPVHLFSTGEAEIEVVLSPTLDFKGQTGLRYAVSIDDGPPQIVNVHEGGVTEREWEQAVAKNAWHKTTRHRIAEVGPHMVKLWMVDPGLVFQRIHLRTGDVPSTYLGPPESPRR